MDTAAHQKSLSSDRKMEKGLPMKMDKRSEIFGFALIGLVVSAVFFPMFFFGKTLFHRDFHFITYPFRFFLHQAFQQGEIPFWAPHDYGGMPFMAALHPGVFYPPSMVFFLGDPVLAINLFYALHFLVLGAFLFLLGGMWGFSFPARMCSALTGVLSGYVMGSVLLSNYFLALVWLPLIFWVFLKYQKERKAVYFVATVFAIAVQTLAACPEISIMTMLLLFLHEVRIIKKGEGASPYISLILSLGSAVVLALALCALQLWPTVKLLAYSPRSSGINFDIHSHWSLEWIQLASLIQSPVYIMEQNSGELFFGFLHTLYMGLFGLISLAVAAVVPGNKRVRFWLIVFVVGVFLALGKNTPIYRYIYQAMPFLKLFRFPAKYYFVSSFAIIFLSGYMLDYLLNQSEERRRKGMAVMTALALCSGAVAWVHYRFPFIGLETPLILLGIFGLAYGLYYSGKMRKGLFAALVVLVVFIDQSLTSLRLLPMIDRSFYDEPPVLAQTAAGVRGKYRVFSGKMQGDPFEPTIPDAPTIQDGVYLQKQYLTPYTGMVYDYENITGRPGLGMGVQDHFLWVSKMVNADPAQRKIILKRSNVGYWVDMDSPTQFDSNRQPLILPDRMKVWDDALPRAFMVPGARVVEADQILDTYYDAAFDPKKEVLLENAVAFTPSKAFTGRVDEVAYRPNGVTVNTSQEGNGFLVLLDSWFPGWTVTVDGTEQPILKANHFYRAVPLGPGAHTLEFEYLPDGFREGCIASGVSLMILPWVAWFLKKRHLKTVEARQGVTTHA